MRPKISGEPETWIFANLIFCLQNAYLVVLVQIPGQFGLMVHDKNGLTKNYRILIRLGTTFIVLVFKTLSSIHTRYIWVTSQRLGPKQAKYIYIYIMTSICLAIVHHLLAFTLFLRQSNIYNNFFTCMAGRWL